MNLVIGNTSQLSHYFPNSFTKISSRNIDSKIFEQQWDRVYICFAEQRTYIKKDDLFNKVNFDYTLETINKLKAKTIICYSTAELWNNTSGPVDKNSSYSYHFSDYVSSKEKVTNFIKNNYNNVLIAYPFNFNSIFRQPPFLFGKIFNSIIHKQKIEIGDTYYYRELLHPAFVVRESLNQVDHKVIGTGNLVFINDFIRKLYNKFNMEYEEYVSEDLKNQSIYRKNIFYAEKQNNKCEDFDLLNVISKEIDDQITNKTS